jgi:hypothetical protein
LNCTVNDYFSRLFVVKLLDFLNLHVFKPNSIYFVQDPVVFSGTLRSNLDPFDMYLDADLWRALQHAHLKHFVEDMPEGLDFMCSEGGDNLRYIYIVGQIKSKLIHFKKNIFHQTPVSFLKSGNII